MSEVQFQIQDFYMPIMKRQVPSRRTLEKYMPPVLGWNRLIPLPEKFTAYPGNKDFRKEAKRKLSISPSMDPLIFDGRPTVIDLFSGCGGFSCGFVQAGWRVIASVEWDYFAHVTYCANIPHLQEAPLHVYSCDIRDLTGREILKNAGINEIDCVIGGPPCQSFSYTGKRKIGDERDNMVMEFCRLVKELQPKTFCFENVPGFKTKKFADGRKVIDVMMEYIQKPNGEDLQALIMKEAMKNEKAL